MKTAEGGTVEKSPGNFLKIEVFSSFGWALYCLAFTFDNIYFTRWSGYLLILFCGSRLISELSRKTLTRNLGIALAAAILTGVAMLNAPSPWPGTWR